MSNVTILNISNFKFHKPLVPYPSLPLPDHVMSPEYNSPFVTKVFLRQSIGSVRLVIALFTITSIVIKLLYDRFLAHLTDFDGFRWTIIGLGCVFFVSTFVRSKRRQIVSFFSLSMYLTTLLYVTGFVLVNQFDPNAVIVLILVIGASSVLINTLSYYAIQSAMIVLASFFVYSNSDLPSENIVAFFNLMLSLGVFGIVIGVRLKLISTLKNSHSNLEKLNVLSIVANKHGEIVFVSPSVRNLLGYEPKELVKYGWWRSPNLREGWINREYILNYPNILPKEIMSIETSVLNKQGKKVWFSWVNSVLPNGSYVGVGLDVTRYKNQDLVTSPA